MTTRRDMDEGDQKLAAEYALGTLPHAERIAFAKRLENEPELQAVVSGWEHHLATLADEIESVEPPAHILPAINTRLFGQTAARRSWWSSVGFWRGLSFASVLAVGVLSTLYLDAIRVPEPQPTYISEMTGETGTVRLVALFDPQTSELKLRRTAGEPAAGRSFELWLIEGDNPPLSLNVLASGSDTTIALPADLAARIPGATLAISDEPEGGSPTGSATGPVLALGEIRPL